MNFLNTLVVIIYCLTSLNNAAVFNRYNRLRSSTNFLSYNRIRNRPRPSLDPHSLTITASTSANNHRGYNKRIHVLIIFGRKANELKCCSNSLIFHLVDSHSNQQFDPFLQLNIDEVENGKRIWATIDIPLPSAAYHVEMLSRNKYFGWLKGEYWSDVNGTFEKPDEDQEDFVENDEALCREEDDLHSDKVRVLFGEQLNEYLDHCVWAEEEYDIEEAHIAFREEVLRRNISLD